MNLWITLRTRPSALLALAVLAVGLAACGSKSSIESGKSDDEIVAQTKAQDASEDTVKIKAEDEASFDERKAEAEAARSAKVAGLTAGSTRSGAGKVTEITVRAGDTLWKLAERKEVYGSGWLYPLILQANVNRIKDPNHLEAGVKLVVPRDVPDPQVEMAKEQAMTGELLDKSPLPGSPAAAAAAVPTPAQAAPMPEQVAPKGHHWAWLLALVAVAGAALWWWRRGGDEAQA